MQVKKAVVTAAGRGVRLYPAADTVQRAMLPLVDRDGLAKPIIQIIAEEAMASGIEEICVVCAPGDEEKYKIRFDSLRDNLVVAHKKVDWAQQQAERVTDLLERMQFAVQDEPLGYGHAVSCAKDFVGSESFLLLLSDHLYTTAVEGKRCAQQLIELAIQESSPVAAVNAVREHIVGRYGTVRGKRVPNRTGAYQIEKITEKPALSLAELEFPTPGLRAGHYLCFFGMHVLPPSIFGYLAEVAESGDGTKKEVQLTPALNKLAERERYLALEVKGKRYDIGAQFGLLQAQIALGLAGQVKDRVLTTIIEVMAEASRTQEPKQ